MWICLGIRSWCGWAIFNSFSDIITSGKMKLFQRNLCAAAVCCENLWARSPSIYLRATSLMLVLALLIFAVADLGSCASLSADCTTFWPFPGTGHTHLPALKFCPVEDLVSFQYPRFSHQHHRKRTGVKDQNSQQRMCCCDFLFLFWDVEKWPYKNTQIYLLICVIHKTNGYKFLPDGYVNTTIMWLPFSQSQRRSLSVWNSMQWENPTPFLSASLTWDVNMATDFWHTATRNVKAIFQDYNAPRSPW